jgi:hypothetical protein
MAEESKQPQIAIAEAIQLLQTFRGADLTQTIYEIENSVKGVSAEKYSAVLATITWTIGDIFTPFRDSQKATEKAMPAGERGHCIM